MNRGFKERQSVPEAEACSRAMSQARVYIEQIRSRVSVGGPNMQSGPKSATLGAKRDYLVDAAKQIRLALERDVGEDYEAAFNHYKNGVDLLLGGIQVESNKERREAVKRKVAQYLKRAEEIFNSHLQKALGNGLIASEGYSSLRFRPIRNLSYPIESLRMCKVVGIIDKVQLVQDPCSGETFILKSLPKSLVERRGQQTIIPQGVPYMVKLLRYYVSEDSIFLRLQHVQGGKLWSHLRRQLHPDMERGKEYPECSSPFRKTIKLKNSYTAPSMSSGLEQEGSWWQSEAKNTWDSSNDASDMHNVPSTNSVYLSIDNGQNPHCSPVSRDEHTSQSSSWVWPGNPPVVGPAVHNDIPNLTFCIGPVNYIREAHQRTDTWWSAAHPTSLTQNSSCSSQRFPAKESSSVTSSEPDLWSPESQTLLEGFRSLQAKVPSLDQRCVNGLCAREGISMVNGEQRIPPGAATSQRIGSHTANSKVMGTQSVLCNAGKAPAEANTDKSFLRDTPLACTEMLTDLHTKVLSGKEAQKIISGSGGVVLPPNGNQGTQSAYEQQDLEVPSPLGREKSIEHSLGSPDASPDIEVDGWCFVSAPLLSETEPRRGSLGAWGLPERQICQWAAEILLALEGLHQQGVICQDLNPRNILLDDTGHICLTYFGQWPEVEPQFSNRALEELYTAPEVRGITEVTDACDWWSFGALLYELLTGMPLSQNHPSGVHIQTRLHLPDTLSCAAGSLLTELLQCDPESRLGSGVDGINKLKSHPFFRNIQWNQLV